MFPVYTGFEKIVEERIKQAQKQGAFDNLSGAGKPLPKEDLSHVSEELRLGYRILKNADCLPPEVELKNEIRQTESLLEEITDVRLKYKTMKKLNFLIMKLNMLRKGSVRFEVPQQYEGALLERMAENKNSDDPA
ncbi:MAG: DUF1992 domain-containing protein [Desulfobacterales bacterium]|nr:DUF1992 domain-containing protein [Desulfobacterales bacterium]